MKKQLFTAMDTSVTRSIHRTYKSNNIPVPKEHFKRVEKAVSLLEPIAEDPKILKMQDKLAYVLDEN